LSYTKIRTLTLPQSVTTLEEYCFKGCSALEVFTIPEGSSLNTIKFGVFHQCSALSKIECGECDDFSVESGALYKRN
jgi:hypothetical protein